MSAGYWDQSYPPSVYSTPEPPAAGRGVADELGVDDELGDELLPLVEPVDDEV